MTGGTVDSELQRHSQHINNQIIQQYSDGNNIQRLSEYHFPRRKLPTDGKSAARRQCAKCSKHGEKNEINILLSGL